MRKYSKIAIIIMLIITLIIMPQITLAKPQQIVPTKNPTQNEEKAQPTNSTKNPTSGEDKAQPTNSTKNPSPYVSNNIAEWNFDPDLDVPEGALNIVGLIISFLRNLSIIITVLVIVILGIKYMMGSVQERAEYKKGYISIIIGVVLITCVTSIVEFIFSASQNLV